MIERDSFNGTPCGRLMPPGKAGKMEGKGEEGGGGGVTSRATALIRMNYSRVALHMLVKDGKKV